MTKFVQIWVYGFISSIYLFMVWFGLLDLVLVFLDLMEEIWLLDLDLGFAGELFMNTKNIFSSYEKNNLK